jgi:RNA polymerase sigma-70 factor (ECF subfamily)
VKERPDDDWNVDRHQAIPRLLEEHGSRLFNLGLRLCGSREAAEDLVQETFLRAFRKWDQFEHRSSPVTWLYTIASRLCRRLHRKRAGEPERIGSLQELLPFGDAKLAVMPSETGDGLTEQIRREGREKVEEAIASLPLTFRQPLVLKEIAGLSVRQTAEILGLKPATVKTRLHRARLRLRQMLEQALPRRELPPPAYSRQVCLDLLRAKQEALDHGVDMPQSVVCERCQAVFASLDLAQDICHELGDGRLPEQLYEALREELDP